MYYVSSMNKNIKTEKIKSFTDLNAWKEGHALVIKIYEVTEEFPKSEQFGLVSQMRRSSASVTSNIAEGFSRRTKKDKIKFYITAHGSLTELQDQLLISRDVGYLSDSNYKLLSDRTVTVHKLITGLIKSAETKNA